MVDFRCEGPESVESDASQTAAGAPRKRPRGRGERTRALILDRAERIFAAKGFEATTLGEIAAAAGIRAPSLYEYFDSKEALYEAMLEDACQSIFDTLDAYVRTPHDQADPRPNLLGKVIQIFRTRPHLPRLMHQEALLGGVRLQGIIQRRMKTVFSRALDVLDHLPSGGRWTKEEIPFVGLAIMHVCTCYYSMAPLYEQTLGLDLLDPRTQDRHAEFLQKFWRMLWFDPPPQA